MEPGTAEHATEVLDRLHQRYPRMRTALVYQDPWQLLVSTIISAQTTDENVNKVTPELFRRWPTPQALAAADPGEVEKVVFSTGFFRQKTKSIVEMSADLVDRYGGEVPPDLEQLVTLRGVGRKTASVVLAEAFGKAAIAVDTHVKRVTNRLGMTATTDPAQIEQALAGFYPKSRWRGVSMRFIQFGRDVCDARRPLCFGCEMNDICPYPDKTPAPE